MVWIYLLKIGNRLVKIASFVGKSSSNLLLVLHVALHSSKLPNIRKSFSEERPVADNPMSIFLNNIKIDVAKNKDREIHGKLLN